MRQACAWAQAIAAQARVPLVITRGTPERRPRTTLLLTPRKTDNRTSTTAPDPLLHGPP